MARTKSKPKSKPSRHYDIQEGQLSDDEVDSFHKSRDVVMFDGEKDDVDEEEDDQAYLELDLSESDEEEKRKEVEEEAAISTAWGKKKSLYYSTDKVEEVGSDDEMKEEEKEALRLQKEILEKTSEADFLDDFGDIVMKSKTSKSKKSEDEMILQSMNHDLDMIPISLTEDMSNIEAVEQNILSLNTEAQRELFTAKYPDLMPILDDMKMKVEELKTKIIPVIALLKGRKKVCTNTGRSYLDYRQHFLYYSLLSSLMCVMNNLEQKSTSHPSFSHLSKVNTLDKNMSLLNARIMPQIDLLLSGEEDNQDKIDAICEKLLASQHNNSLEEEEQDDNSNSEESEGDNLSEENEVSDDNEEDVDSNVDNENEDLSDDGVSEDDLEIPEGLDDQDEDSDAIESKLLSIKTKKTKSRDIVESKAVTSLKRSIKSDVGKTMSKPISKKAIESFEDDDDLDFDLPMTKPSKRKNSELENDDALEYYESVAANKKHKQKEKENKKHEMVSYPVEDELLPGQRRHAGQKILKNRGLVPYRKKDVRNPRLHMRNKFEKAMKKRGSQVKTYKGKEDNYSGEKSGIKTHLARSIRL